MIWYKNFDSTKQKFNHFIPTFLNVNFNLSIGAKSNIKMLIPKHNLSL